MNISAALVKELRDKTGAGFLDSKKALEQNIELGKLYENDEKVRNLLDIAMGLEGLPRQASTHACRSCYYKRPSNFLCSTICK